MQIRALTTALGCLLAVGTAQAEPSALAHPFYGQATVSYGSTEIGDSAFNPSVVSLSGGAWIRDGIGVELGYGAAFDADETDGMTLDVPSFGSLAVRFQSPEDFGIKAHLTAGYGWFEVDGEVSDSGYPGNETFSGPVVGLGLLFPVRPAYPWSVALEYAQHFGNDDMHLSTIGLGLRCGY